MSKATIEQLQTYDPTQMQYPCIHEQKLDGVPVRIVRNGGKITSFSRQGKVVKSIKHIEDFCQYILTEEGECIVAELYIPGKPFKEISGLVRQHNLAKELRAFVFDGWVQPFTSVKYAERRDFIKNRLYELSVASGVSLDSFPVVMIPGTWCSNEQQADEAHNALMLSYPNAEGSVYHYTGKCFQPGTRLWTTQKRKPIPTIYLRVVGFEEAISQDGTPLGMVGRVNAEYTKYDSASMNMEVIGIGPGALTHAERKALWREYRAGKYAPKIAEIKYMRDDSYDALRQPTFVHWCEDKGDTSGQGR